MGINSAAGQPGDFDGDGDVDGVDLTHATLGWETRFGVDLDGMNFLDWQREFGTGVSPLSSAQAIPEPTTSALALATILLFVGRRRR